MNPRINSSRDLKLFARELHARGTAGEAILWYTALKSKKMDGYQFHRRYPIGDSYVDFICLKLNLIIEIHSNSVAQIVLIDQKREEDLKKMGYTVLSFTEPVVIGQLDEVVTRINYTVKSIEKNVAGKTG